MTIKTKYEIGQTIFFLENTDNKKKYAELYEDKIEYVIFDKDGVKYGLKETCDEIKERYIFTDLHDLKIKYNEMQQQIEEMEHKI